MATKDSVDKLHERQDIRERREERAQILAWLSSIDFTSQQHDYLRRRQPGTGQWLLESRTFQQWLKTPGKTLFCPGIPGTGKTTLTAIVVDHLLNSYTGEPSVGRPYIYCNFRRQDEQKLDDLLSNLLKQLSDAQHSIPDATRELYERHQPKRKRPPADELLLALQSVASSYTRTFVIVDALDECQISDGCRTRFIEYCFDLQARCQTNLFFTSRFLQGVTERFDEAEDS